MNRGRPPFAFVFVVVVVMAAVVVAAVVTDSGNGHAWKVGAP